MECTLIESIGEMYVFFPSMVQSIRLGGQLGKYVWYIPVFHKGEIPDVEYEQMMGTTLQAFGYRRIQ